MKTRPIIELKNVTKKFKEAVAVNNVSLEIYEGEYVALLGPNGAGKTTLVEMIEGVTKPDSGEILIEGLPWRGHEKYLKSILGVSFQETRFMDKATVYETLNLFSAFYNIESSRVSEVLETVGLTEKRNDYIDNLSGGQRQKLAIGIALVNDPKILLLDEPTTGLDPKARKDIWEILKNLQTQGRTMILTTHYMEEAEYLCEKVLMMNSGQILSRGNLHEMLRSHDEGGMIEITMENESEANRFYTEMQNLKMNCERNEKMIFLKSKNHVADMKSILLLGEEKDVWISNVQCRAMTLNDLFILLAGKKLHE